MSANKVPTIFLSAATDDLEVLRNVLHGAFARAGFRVFTQRRSLGASPGTLREFLVKHIRQSDCVIHLAGMLYGSDADEPFPNAPGFQCSWTQFEYYYPHQQNRKVIAFVCTPALSRRDFAETGIDAVDIVRKQRLQQEHRQRVASGEFTGTPLAGTVKRTLNESVNSWEELLQAIAASVASVHGLAGNLSFEPRLHTLPNRPIFFIGREADLAKLRRLNAADGTVLTGLRGMGGIGKTALALVLALEWATEYPDAQLFLDAHGTQANPPGAGDLLAQVVQTFRPTQKLPEDEAELKSLYYQVLADKKALILLDNARDAAQATPLIPPAGCAFLVTSRNNFMVGNRPAYSVDKLPAAEASILLREHYADLSDADAAALVKLCAGLPLALRLAGAHLALDASERGGVANVTGYLNKLRASRLGTLDAEANDAALVTISETLRLSESQLIEAERLAWRKLGVFTSSFDERAAKEIAGAGEEMLGRFVRRSLLERDGTDRYRLHDLSADYARGQLIEAESTELHLAHARHYTAIGKEANELYLEGQAVAGLALFDRERVQIEVTYAWLAGRDIEAAARQLIALVNAVADTCDLRFHPRQLIIWFEGQLRAAHTVKDRKCEGIALTNLGNAHHDLSDWRKAIGFCKQGLAIAREISDRRGEGNALAGLGNAHRGLGDSPKAIEFCEQALAIAREINSRRGEGSVLGDLGSAHQSLGDSRKAIEFYEQALAIDREIGNRRGEGSVLGKLGSAHQSMGDSRKAIEFYEQRLVIAREIGDRRGEGSVLGNLGNVHQSLGDSPKAIEFYEQRLVIAREIGDRRGEGSVLGNLGSAHQSLGESRKAIEFYEQRLVIDREIGDQRGEVSVLGNLGNVHQSLGDSPKAIEYHEQALAIAREIDDQRGEGRVLGNLGNAHQSLGDSRKAIEFYAQRLVIARKIGDRRGEVSVLGNLGSAHQSLGDSRKAIEFYEQALAIAREIGDRRGEGSVLGKLGNAHQSLGDSRKAIEYHEQVLAIAREIGDQRGEGIVLGNLGNAHRSLGDSRKAIELCQQSLAIAVETGYRLLEGNVLWLQAQAAEKQNDLTQAIACATHALHIYEAIEAPETEKVRLKLAEWRGQA